MCNINNFILVCPVAYYLYLFLNIILLFDEHNNKLFTRRI